MAENEVKNDDNARFHVTGQYVKDLSFENPRAPQSLIGNEEKPKIEVNIDLNASKLRDDLYEVVLKVSVKAAVKEENLFLTDLAYAGLFTLQNIPEDRLQQILFVDCPFVLFPYARRIVSDATRDGGFPPLMLEPIDFFAMYRKRLETQQAQAEAANATAQ
ncbi:MAG: protein-export chaperone SecB [Alphaproteobacteria bacterium]|nr:protein-export chaperone SecB [Alphaproteobacteria bacterium]